MQNKCSRCAVILVLAAVGCQRTAPPAGMPAAPTRPTIMSIKPEKRAVKRIVEQPGTIQPFEETVLHAKVPGFVGSIAPDPDKKDKPAHDQMIDISSVVKKDQLLAELSVPELEKEWKQKLALVKQAEAEVVQSEKALTAATEGIASAKASIAEAEASLARAEALFKRWQSEVNRITGLVKDGVIDAQTRDETMNQFKAAEAGRNEGIARVASAKTNVKKVEADREKSMADVDAARARLEVTKAEVERIEALRNYTKIKSPYDGVVTRRNANTGDFVSSTGKADLFTIARLDPVRVVIQVPEADTSLITIGQEATLSFQASGGGTRTGKVTRTSWALEPGSRTLRVEIDLPNADAKLRPGMYVHARLTTDLPADWSVPVAAIGKVGDDTVMYLAEGGKAVRVQVQLGRGDNQHTQVRRLKRANATDWTDITGSETIALPAASLSDGQQLP